MIEDRMGQAMKGEEHLTTQRPSDQSIVPMKESNNSGGKGLTAEQGVLGRHRPDTERGEPMETKLRRLTEIARGNPKVQFTSLAHYLNEEFLKACYEELKKNTAAGVDRVTVEEYGKHLEPNLRVKCSPKVGQSHKIVFGHGRA